MKHPVSAMNKPRSIKQKAPPDALPDFRNLGVILRILLFSNGLALLNSMLQANVWQDVPLHLMQISLLFTPVLLGSLLLLWLLTPWLQRLPYVHGMLAVTSLVVVLTLVIYYSGGELYRQADVAASSFDAVRYALLGVVVCSFLLMYFRLRARGLSHALHNARLQMLRARIRPHFLFNTINAVLGIVRSQPGQAEVALQDMADLFRMAMSNAHDLVPLRHEIQLSKQYIALEQLRMGERLRVEWQVQDVPDDALVPSLLLQPLLENAVYHGIEPLPQGGLISVTLSRNGSDLRLQVENPCTPRHDDAPHNGNRMAVQNIRERLQLLFDVEARYRAERGRNFYRVNITLPYTREKRRGAN